MLALCLKSQSEFARKTAAGALNNALNGASGDLAKSDVMAALRELSGRVRQSPAKEKILFVVSDMLENSSISSFYSNRKIRNLDISAEIKKATTSHQIGDFAGARVFVLGAGLVQDLASVAGIRGLPGAEAYSASKAATIAYLESLRLEMRACGIKVVTIAPGYIETPMTAVNPYRMPFLLPAEEAARRFAAAIETGNSYTVIPWQMGVLAKLLRVLPNAVYDRLFAGAPRKPRLRRHCATHRLPALLRLGWRTCWQECFRRTD